MRATIGLALALLPAPALAQDANARDPWIEVVGSATVSTQPDLANLVYWVIGEGATADEASAALAAKQQAIAGGLQSLLGGDTQLFSGEVMLIETRLPECDGGAGNSNARPRLSEGVCEVTGYIASLQGTARTPAVDKSGTAVGLAARLGARDARMQGYQLSDPAEAQHRAAAEAIANARKKAQAVAAGGGVQLGQLISLTDQNWGNEVVVSGHRSAGPPPPPPPAPPPVEIDVSPRPIETQARVVARFAISP